MASILLVILYIAFISLGLPNSLLGSAWPTMQADLQLPMSAAGVISMVIFAGTVLAALLSSRITYRLDSGRITAVSMAMICVSMFGFTLSGSMLPICGWALIYGFGSGFLDVVVNYYVAVHYSTRAVSWIQGMWGIGASVSPYIMGWAISAGKGWATGYRLVGMSQIVVVILLIISLPMWQRKKRTSPIDDVNAAAGVSEDPGANAMASGVTDDASAGAASRPMKITEILVIRGVPALLMTFFLYGALECTAGLWAASYFQFFKGVSAGLAASMASLYYIGLTGGRYINGFLAMRFNDNQLIRLGAGVTLAGILMLILPLGNAITFAGIVIAGVGCAPIYPCIVHFTPTHFEEKKAESIVGIQMACGYFGSMVMPPVFGLLGEHISMGLLPAFLLALLIGMIVTHEWMNKIV